MEKVIFGNTGMEISRVVFGGIVTMDETPGDSEQFVSYAIDHGINYFDVAPSYGDAEIKLGNALKPYRNSIYLACKTGERSQPNSQKELEQSMKLLHTDYFDNYQLHAMTTEEDLSRAFGEGGVMETIRWAKEQGYIRHAGITAHNEDIALKALELYDFDTVLFPLNFAMSLGKDYGNRISKLCKEKGKGLLGMKTLAHRQWLDEEEHKAYPKSWCKTIYNNDRLGIAALKYTLSMGADAVVPPGNFEQFRFAVEHMEECLKNPLNAEDLAYLKSETELIGGRFIF